MTTLQADWIFPVDHAPIARGTITFESDTLVSVNQPSIRSVDKDLGQVAIIPGLVNAHTHLDLSSATHLRQEIEPGKPTDWLRQVIAHRRSQTPEQIAAAIAEGIIQLQRSGTTLVGDICVAGTSEKQLATVPLRSIVYHELIGLDAPRLRQAWQQCQGAVSPHAPYSVNVEVMHELLSSHHPLATHIAEFHEEAELLEHRRGPFVAFLQQLGVYHPEGLATSWHDFLTSNGSTAPQLLIHANYLPSDIALSANQSVVYCPRTHAAFGHPPHPFQEMLAHGINLCLGTDSLASNPDLDVFEEARFLYQQGIDGELLLRMLTLNGAKAMGFDDITGSLQAGKSADFVTLPIGKGDDPYRLLFESVGERRLWFKGEVV